MEYRHEDQQRRQQLLTVVDRGNAEQLFTFLQAHHRQPFRNLAEVMAYQGVIDDNIDFIDCTGTRYNVTPLIIAAGKGSYEKAKILLVHGANPNKQCSTGDTALNLAVHRQKYHIVDLLLQYRANPNICNQSGKTALHRAVASYVDENANQIRALFQGGADPTIEDRNQRIPLDEAVIANKPEILGILLSHNRDMKDRAYRAAIIAARLGHDECLKILLNSGMDPNITDRTHTTPLHVAVRSLKLSTARLLVSYGADQNMANNRGETPVAIAEYLQPDQQQSFLNVLAHTPKIQPSEIHKFTTSTMQVNDIPYVHPLLRSRPNWTLDSDEFRSQTNSNSSVQNLLDPSNGTFWCCTLNRDAFVIFDFKHQYNINGIRIIGCDHQSTPKSGHVDVSNAFNGPWLRVKDFTCPSTRNANDFLFSPLKTRFIRVFITDNYGGDDIRIQGIGFYGVDMRLVNILQQFGLERSLPALLANGINDLEALDEKRDEILNSSDRYLDVNDHFQFIRLTESLKSPKLTRLEWFNPPQSAVVAGEKLQTFSAAGDESVTNRVKLEEKTENSPQIRTVLVRDLEPIQGRSLVDFPDYFIKDPGRYKVRVVSVEAPDIQTPWQDIVVGVKPPIGNAQISDGLHGRPTAPIPGTSPVTDIEAETVGMPKFTKVMQIRRTPRPRPDSSRTGNGDDDDEDSEPIVPINSHHHPRETTISRRSKLMDEATQSEQRPTRSVGTMHEPIQTRNFGNEAQPQTSSTQTSFPPEDREKHLIDVAPPVAELTPRRIPSRSSHSPRQHLYHVDAYVTPEHHRIIRSPFPPEVDDADYPRPQFYPQNRPRTPVALPYEPEYSHREVRPHYDPNYNDEFTRPRFSLYDYHDQRSRTTSPIRRPHTPTPPRHRPRMRSQETDTSLDSMKRRQHTGVQYEPRPTQEKGTTPSLRGKRPSSTRRSPIPTTSSYPRQRHQTPILRDFQYSLSRSHKKDDYFYTHQREYDEEEERAPSKHDQSTMADLIVNFDHYTQCDSQPFMADRYIQTTPLYNEIGVDEVSINFPEEQDIGQLPAHGSISISQPVVIQPDTLPRPYRAYARPKRDGLDYTGSNIEVPLHRGQLQRTTSIRNSPLLNIGTEHMIRQSPANEFATPFENYFVYESDGSSTLSRHNFQTNRNNSVVRPVINSARTHLFQREPVRDSGVRQSRTNGNFFLTTPPVRSMNSSFRLDISREES